MFIVVMATDIPVSQWRRIVMCVALERCQSRITCEPGRVQEDRIAIQFSWTQEFKRTREMQISNAKRLTFNVFPNANFQMQKLHLEVAWSGFENVRLDVSSAVHTVRNKSDSGHIWRSYSGMHPSYLVGALYGE